MDQSFPDIVRFMKKPARFKTDNSQNTLSFLPLSLLLLLFVVLTFLSLILITQLSGWRVYQNSQRKLQVAQVTALAGTVHFSGLKPEKGDAGQLKVLVRRLDSSQEWEDVDIKLPLEQDTPWQWDEALPGVNYQVQTTLVVEGREIKKSETEIVTAPAETIRLLLDIDWSDLPKDVVSASKATISGDIIVNGYIPSKTTLEVIALHPSDTTGSIPTLSPEVIKRGTVLATVASPQTTNPWTWDQAIPQQDYLVVAVLKQGVQIIGTSQEIVSTNIGDNTTNFTINSVASPLPPPAVKVQKPIKGVGQRLGTSSEITTISGTVSLNGPKNANTSLLMLWRKPGDQNYQVIGRYDNPPTSGTTWQWNSAEVGVTYQIMAVLQVNEQNTSSAPSPVTVTAPATQVNFTLNTYYVIPATQGIPVLETCLRKDSDNWNAIIRLPRIQGAGNYWLGVGNAPYQSNVYNQIFPAGANSSDPKVSVVVQDNRQHFMQYSYSSCEDCTNQNNLAPPSQQVAFTCQ
jgi:hypothetical protein